MITIRFSRLALFYLCSISTVCVQGFHVGSAIRSSRGLSLRAESGLPKGKNPSKATDFVEKISTMNTDVDAIPPAIITQTPKEVNSDPKRMDEGIFKFNKQLIDTVYNIICFLYPVRGNDRDFARFFVLETVARVPYFAYLSCLHLQETFGVRYPSMSDRMRTQ